MSAHPGLDRVLTTSPTYTTALSVPYPNPKTMVLMLAGAKPSEETTQTRLPCGQAENSLRRGRSAGGLLITPDPRLAGAVLDHDEDVPSLS